MICIIRGMRKRGCKIINEHPKPKYKRNEWEGKVRV